MHLIGIIYNLGASTRHKKCGGTVIFPDPRLAHTKAFAKEVRQLGFSISFDIKCFQTDLISYNIYLSIEWTFVTDRGPCWEDPIFGKGSIPSLLECKKLCVGDCRYVSYEINFTNQLRCYGYSDCTNHGNFFGYVTYFKYGKGMIFLSLNLVKLRVTF